jgi:hypothetical protein
MVKSSGLRQAPRNFDFRFSIVLKKIVLVALPARELNFDKFKPGGSSNLELGNHLNICFKTEEIQENLCRDGRSQDLPDTY